MPEIGTQTSPQSSLRDGNGGAAEASDLRALSLDAYVGQQQQLACGRRDDTPFESEEEYEASTVSSWTNFRRHYSCESEPDICLKIRKRWVSHLLEDHPTAGGQHARPRQCHSGTSCTAYVVVYCAVALQL